nr:uncharacterized protein LOC109174175 [Ipomoea batatas]
MRRRGRNCSESEAGVCVSGEACWSRTLPVSMTIEAAVAIASRLCLRWLSRLLREGNEVLLRLRFSADKVVVVQQELQGRRCSDSPSIADCSSFPENCSLNPQFPSLSVENLNEEWVQDRERMKGVIQEYYKTLYTKDRAIEETEELNGLFPRIEEWNWNLMNREIMRPAPHTLFYGGASSLLSPIYASMSSIQEISSTSSSCISRSLAALSSSESLTGFLRLFASRFGAVSEECTASLRVKSLCSLLSLASPDSLCP